MNTDHPFPWHRLAKTLSATPRILRYLLNDISLVEADFRPNEERLAIREILPHLTAWDKVILGQLKRMCFEDNPNIDDDNEMIPDETLIDIETQLARFAEGRAALVCFLEGRSLVDWGCEAIRAKYGPTTLDAQVMMVIMHDSYHINQVVELRNLFQSVTRNQS